MSEAPLVNVLVIGLGLAGATAARTLATALPPSHRLVCVSATESAYFPVAALRGGVVPGWESKISLPLDTFFPPGSRHVVLAGTKVVELNKNTVKVDKAHPGFGLEISFAYAVVATGSTYPFPCRPPADSSIRSVHSLLVSLQSAVKAASSILVVGAGPVGIEFAGEVAAEYPEKKVTIVHSGQALMEDFKPSLGAKLLSQLKGEVKVVLGCRVDTKGLETGSIENQRFDLGNGEEVEADFIMIAYGNTPNSSVIKTFDPTLVNDAGRVILKPTLQFSSADSSLDHIFAVGDITNIVETKLWYTAQAHAPIVSQNIVSLIQGKPPNSLKTHVPGAPLIVVSVGPRGGAGQLFFGIVVGAWATAMAKSKTLFVDKFVETYKA